MTQGELLIVVIAALGILGQMAVTVYLLGDFKGTTTARLSAVEADIVTLDNTTHDHERRISTIEGNRARGTHV